MRQEGPFLGPEEAMGTPQISLPQAACLVCPQFLSWVTFHWGLWWGGGGAGQEREDFSKGLTCWPRGLWCAFPSLPRALVLFGPVGVVSEHEGLQGGAGEGLRFKAGP